MKLIKHTTVILILGITFSYTSCKKIAENIPAKQVVLTNVTTFIGVSGSIGTKDGTGASASFFFPRGLAIDAADNIYVADFNNYKIRKITSEGVVTTLAGSGTTAGTGSGNVDGNGTAAMFSGVTDVAVDGAGNVFVADGGNYKIRKITPSGEVTTFAGGTVGTNDGIGVAAQFTAIRAIAFDASGNLFITDNDRIRKITPTAQVTTFATGLDVSNGLAIDKQGNLILGIYNKLYKVTATGVVSVFAGSTRGYANGTLATALFKSIEDVAIDAAGNLYISEAFDCHRIRKITPAGEVSTLTGSTASTNGVYGSTNGLLAVALYNYPKGLAFDSKGNLFVADSYNHVIRKIGE